MSSEVVDNFEELEEVNEEHSTFASALHRVISNESRNLLKDYDGQKINNMREFKTSANCIYCKFHVLFLTFNINYYVISKEFMS